MHIEKKSRGRPKGRKFTERFQVPMEPAMRAELDTAASEEGRPAAELVRELISKWLRRRG